MKKREEDASFISMRDKAISQLKSGKSLTGEGGVFEPLLKSFLESALDSEMESHLSESERFTGNKRNGRGTKTIKTGSGSIEINTPQDRNSTFEPTIVSKRQTILADSLESKIIGLYSLGMSYRDISAHIKEMYNESISAQTLSDITDRIIPSVKSWQSRALQAVYPIVWLDAMHYKVREGGQVVSRAIYNVLAINKEGKKEHIGVFVSESEGAKFWLSVLTDLKNRGLEDILIACTDNLKGFSESIHSVFPKTEIQKCVVHQIRNSIKYVASKDQKAFIKDLKPVYQAVSLNEAEIKMLELEEKWAKKYPLIIQSWQNNWEELTAYFQYDQSIRKIIYTTNAVEGFHRQIRKVTKTKGAFPTDMSLLKLVYLASENISKKWGHPIHNWGLAAQQLAIKFEGRFNIGL